MKLGDAVLHTGCAKMAEPIEMPFGMLSWVGPRNHVLDGGSRSPVGRGNFERKGHAGRLDTPRGGK